MGKFVITENKSGWHFNLKANNGEIIGTSEKYSSLDTCKNGIESVRKNSAAAVEDQTVEGFETLSNPKFELYESKNGEFRFRLQARNGEIILTSEGYKAKASCKNGIDSVKSNAPAAEVVTE